MRARYALFELLVESTEQGVPSRNVPAFCEACGLSETGWRPSKGAGVAVRLGVARYFTGLCDACHDPQAGGANDASTGAVG